MSKPKAARTTPKIAGSMVYGKGDLAAVVGNSVHKHSGKFHVYVGLKEVLVTTDMDAALKEAATRREA